MPRYMLDTGTCSYVMERSNPQILKRLQKTPVSDVCISVVTKAELLFGVELSPRRQQDATALTEFLRYVESLDFPYAAAHALSLGLTLVTNNTREFRRIPNLPSKTGPCSGQSSDQFSLLLSHDPSVSTFPVRQRIACLSKGSDVR